MKTYELIKSKIRVIIQQCESAVTDRRSLKYRKIIKYATK